MAGPRVHSPNKFNARRTTRGGEVFDSAAEADRWDELRLLEWAGNIRGLTRQPRFILEPRVVLGTGKARRVLRAVTHRPDFGYEEVENGVLVVEEVKGGRATQTPAFRLRMRLFLGRFPNIDYRLMESR